MMRKKGTKYSALALQILTVSPSTFIFHSLFFSLAFFLDWPSLLKRMEVECTKQAHLCTHTHTRGVVTVFIVGFSFVEYNAVLLIP